ncbi:hypothetical protein L208DRAFT_1280121 [Tricholoma matsutake]|nr:hypothetical protein L208DRAFT_1280121 [Tricholoma matsutake 945]
MDGIPDGYVSISSDDGQQYLVPHFMIPATNQAFKAYQKKLEFNVFNADGGGKSIHSNANMPSLCMANAAATANAKPNCNRELLSCHAAVKALQDQFGISYKDASHCLYLAEVEKLKQQDITLKTYMRL